MKTRLNYLFPSTLLLLAAMGAVVVACGDDDSPVTPTNDGGADVATDTSTTPDAVAETGTDSASDAPLRQGLVDRVGRTAILETLVASTNKDGYNRGDTFTFAGGIDGGTISTDFQRRLVTLDLLDTTDNWDGGSPDGSTALVDAGPDADAAVVPAYPHPLVAVFRNDVLVVNTALAFCADGYLGIEDEVLRQGTAFASAASCGGRWLGDDAVDRGMSFVIRGERTGILDNVPAATKAPTLTFPYLAGPN